MNLVSGRTGSVVIAGAVARRPDRAGHAWAFLQYILGFRRLGWDVVWLDSIDGQDVKTGAHENAVRAFDRLTRYAGIEESAGLLVDASEPGGPGLKSIRGLSPEEILRRVGAADLFINVMGYIRNEEILAGAPRTLFLDIDPGFGQMWEDLGLARLFYGHDAYATVGERIGAPDCEIPTLGIDWITTPPPVVLDRFGAHGPDDRAARGRGAESAAWTSIVSWRGPFEPIDYRGSRYGLRVHEFRRFIDLPKRTGVDFRLALDIDEADRADRDRLHAAGWSLLDPDHVAELDDYQRFIRHSSGEIMIAKELYVMTHSGWFSDRSTCYLASGRPVVAQDTGWSRRYPAGRGLFSFDDSAEAAAAIQKIERAPGAHGRAAREIAEAYFDSDRVLGRLAHLATSHGSQPTAPRPGVAEGVA